MSNAANRHVLFVDGVCVLCHHSVAFFSKIDYYKVLTFGTLQGETAEGVLAGTPQAMEREGVQSVIYVRHCGTPEQEIYVRSTAALQALKDIGGLWHLVSWLRVVPRPLRDFIYDLIAKYRYRWFGKLSASCPLPTEDEAARLVS